MLPVERLYGQTALVAIGRGRCDQCNVCTPRGCLDLAGDKSIAPALGPARRSHAWMRSPFGAFALIAWWLFRALRAARPPAHRT